MLLVLQLQYLPPVLLNYFTYVLLSWGPTEGQQTEYKSTKC